MKRDPNRPRAQRFQQRGSLTLQGSVWRLRYREPINDNGVRKQLSVEIGSVRDFGSFDAVRAEADRVLDAAVPRRLLPGSSVPWESWCDRFVREYLCMLRASSQVTVLSVLNNHLRPSFAHLRTHELTVPVIQEWVSAQVRAGTTRNTVAARFGVLRNLLRKALAAGLAVTPPPPRSITFSRQSEMALPKELGFTANEVERIVFAAEPEWFQTFLAMLASTGLRVGEALALRTSHLQFGDHARITIRQTVSRGRVEPTKTARSMRDVPITDDLLDYVWQHAMGLLVVDPNDEPAPGFDPYLFAGPSGNPRAASHLRTDHLLPLLARLGIPARSFHAFRHGLATRLLERGASISAVRDLLGHSSIDMTNVYAAPSVLAQGVAMAMDHVLPRRIMAKAPIGTLLNCDYSETNEENQVVRSDGNETEKAVPSCSLRAVHTNDSQHVFPLFENGELINKD